MDLSKSFFLLVDEAFRLTYDQTERSIFVVAVVCSILLYFRVTVEIVKVILNAFLYIFLFINGMKYLRFRNYLEFIYYVYAACFMNSEIREKEFIK